VDKFAIGGSLLVFFTFTSEGIIFEFYTQMHEGLFERGANFHGMWKVLLL